jgi:hypothetical protein
MGEEIDKLLEKLQKARFSGELRLRLESGEIASAKLIHLLALSELSGEIPLIEPEKEFTLKP